MNVVGNSKTIYLLQSFDVWFKCYKYENYVLKIFLLKPNQKGGLNRVRILTNNNGRQNYGCYYEKYKNFNFSWTISIKIKCSSNVLKKPQSG